MNFDPIYPEEDKQLPIVDTTNKPVVSDKKSKKQKSTDINKVVVDVVSTNIKQYKKVRKRNKKQADLLYDVLYHQLTPAEKIRLYELSLKEEKDRRDFVFDAYRNEGKEDIVRKILEQSNSNSLVDVTSSDKVKAVHDAIQNRMLELDTKDCIDITGIVDE